MKQKRFVTFNSCRGKYYITNERGQNCSSASEYADDPATAVVNHKTGNPGMSSRNDIVYLAFNSETWPAPWTNWQPNNSQSAPVVPQTTNSTEVKTTMQIGKPVYFVGTLTKNVITKDDKTITTFSDQPTNLIICETEEDRDKQIALKQQLAITNMNGNPGLNYEVVTGTIDGFAALPKPTITKFDDMKF